MTYDVILSNRFKKDYKLMKRRGAPMEELNAVIDLLRQGSPLPAKYRDHMLSGTYVGHHECHIKPDWLLIYYVAADVLVLTMTRTGSHSDLFG